MRSFVYLCSFQQLLSQKCQTCLILCTICWIQQNIPSSLGKIFKSSCKDLFGPFRKYYGLRTSELPLAKFQRLKKQDFRIPFGSLNQNINCLYTKYYFLTKAYSSANLLNTVLEILSVTFDTTFTHQFFEFETALCNSPKIVQCKKYILKMFI